MYETPASLSPRRLMRELDFTDAVDDRLPEISEHCKGLWLDHGFIQHFPNDGEFDERAGAAFAGDEAVAEANQLEQAVLPGVDANFDVDPWVRFRCSEKIGGHAVGFSAAPFRTA